MYRQMVTDKKMAQVAAYLASKVGAARINYMRLLKLMYLADRESLSRLGEPISYDEMFSLDHGLVLSRILNIVKTKKSLEDFSPWHQYFTARQDESDYFLGIKKQIKRDDLDYLSDMDIEILDAMFAKFGSMDEWALSKYMHKKCKEWENPKGSRISVNEESLLKLLGLSEEEAADKAVDIQRERSANFIFRNQ
jgi:uncharacterized phage-associated protein